MIQICSVIHTHTHTQSCILESVWFHWHWFDWIPQRTEGSCFHFPLCVCTFVTTGIKIRKYEKLETQSGSWLGLTALFLICCNQWSPYREHCSVYESLCVFASQWMTTMDNLCELLHNSCQVIFNYFNKTFDLKR